MKLDYPYPIPCDSIIVLNHITTMTKKRISHLITITCLLFTSTAPAQNSNTLAHKFLTLNHYETDSL